MASRRGPTRAVKESSVRIVEEKLIKVEPEFSTDFHGEFQTSHKARKKSQNIRSCSTQVYPEDIDEEDCNMKIPSVDGENEPILPVDQDPIIPQCRFCLRRVSQNNLMVILNKHKAKAAAAFRIKVFINDAYPFACRNCLNLLEVLLDFRQTVMKARNLLLTQRTHLEAEGWDDPTLLQAVADCRTAVQEHRKQVDLLYESQQQQQPTTSVKCEEVFEFETMPEVQPDSFEEVVYPDEQPSLVVPIETDEQEADVGSDDTYSAHSSEAQDEEDVDYLVEPKKQKKQVKDGQPAKSSKSKPKRQKKAEADSSKNQRNNNKTGKPHLCDLCGAKVCPQAAEAHKNRHLGIKPYTCPAIGCELTFHSRHNQTLHMRRSHGENGVPTHKCNICGQLIRGPIGALKYHQLRHTVTEKNHVCQICGKGFTMPWYLTQHSIIHSGEFPHKCSYCGKKFNNKWSMKTHEKNIHEKRNDVPMGQEHTNTEENPDASSSYAAY